MQQSNDRRLRSKTMYLLQDKGQDKARDSVPTRSREEINGNDVFGWHSLVGRFQPDPDAAIRSQFSSCIQLVLASSLR